MTIEKQCIICKDNYYAKDLCKRHYERQLRMKLPEYRLRNSIKTKNYRYNIKHLLLEILGNKCIKCGFNDTRALQFDHINGDGYKDVMNLTANTLYMKYMILHENILKNKYQILCANCNAIKKVENNENKKGYNYHELYFR